VIRFLFSWIGSALPSPGGKVPPKGADEECGQRFWSFAFVSDLLRRGDREAIPRKVFAFSACYFAFVKL